MRIRAKYVLLLLAIASCTPGQAYVQADLDTYDAIAPEYLDYVDADPDLSDSDKRRRQRTVESWKQRLDAGGESR